MDSNQSWVVLLCTVALNQQGRWRVCFVSRKKLVSWGLLVPQQSHKWVICKTFSFNVLQFKIRAVIGLLIELERDIRALSIQPIVSRLPVWAWMERVKFSPNIEKIKNTFSLRPKFSENRNGRENSFPLVPNRTRFQFSLVWCGSWSSDLPEGAKRAVPVATWNFQSFKSGIFFSLCGE